MPEINILNANLGISGVLDTQEAFHMPEARLLPTTTTHKTGLSELFETNTTNTFLEKALCPSIGDGTILQPDVFHESLKGCLETLKDVQNPDVRSFVSAELAPLLENETLLQAYSGLLVGG